MNRPLLAPLAGLSCGLATAGLYGVFLSLWTAYVLLAIMLGAAWLRRPLCFAVFAAVFFFCWGNCALHPYLKPKFPPNHIAGYAGETPCIVEGVIAERPEALERGSRFVMRVEHMMREGVAASATGRLLVTVGEGKSDFLTGDRVRFEARIRNPRNFGLPGEPDRERRLALREIYAIAFVPRADALFLTRGAVENPFGRFMDATALEIASGMKRLLPGEEGAVVRALLIGDRGEVSRGTEELFARTGVNHILSISGFHVSIVASAIFFILLAATRFSAYLMLRFNLRRFLLLLALPVLVSYLFISGAAPATTRSVIMIGVYIIALFLERESDAIHSLMLAAFLILLLQPPALFDISFQLSFLALWGIFVLVPLLMHPFRVLPQKAPIRLVTQFMMVSLAASLATMVPVVAVFHRTSLTGLLSNFVVVPLMGYGAVLLGFAAVPILSIAPMLAGILLKGAGLTVTLSIQALRFLDRIPQLPQWNPRPLHHVLVIMLLCLFTFVRPSRIRRIIGWSGIAIFAVACVPLPHSDKQLTIAFFSLGQCESTLVTFPDGRTMLVDGGGSLADGPDVGERLLAPALWTMGVDRIDYMVLTHPDSDHMKGLNFVAAHFPVGEFWETGIGDSQDYRDLKEILASRLVPVRRTDSATAALRIGEVRIDPLWPEAGIRQAGEEENHNETSLVFRLVYRDFSMLFTADIGAETERELMAARRELACTVLKVPHHGSRHSSSTPFLQRTKPRLALISAGYGNNFHLPHPDALSRLEMAGATVFRTDRDGTVFVSSDGKTFSVKSWKGETGNSFDNP
ncbi:MAG: DNA internalization-related competence protein ComEC/Rec2 [Geobacter sp.]|nr:DNA internalization-related competence protein ComEC/Rec2 [Geobacter sp.]